MLDTPRDSWHGFFIKPNGEIEEIDANGEGARWWDEPALYDTLVLAGYPLSRDDGFAFDFIDLSVDRHDPRSVTVYTAGAGPHEHDMGAASALFLDWYNSVAA